MARTNQKDIHESAEDDRLWRSASVRLGFGLLVNLRVIGLTYREMLSCLGRFHLRLFSGLQLPLSPRLRRGRPWPGRESEHHKRHLLLSYLSQASPLTPHHFAQLIYPRKKQDHQEQISGRDAQ